MGTLYIVSTPIGNLKDITIRAMEILESVDVIACEDTRKTGMLLKHISEKYTQNFQKRAQLISYYEQIEFRRIPEIINALVNGQNVALVSDAGTPLVSDPGYRLVSACVERNIAVTSVPGASSVISALTVSGLPSDKFLFLGYPPHKTGHRIKLLDQLKSNPISTTIIMLEAPHKLIKTLEEIHEILGDIDIVLCRELTKVYEEVRREKVSQSLKHFAKTTPKGEFTILFHL